MTTVVKSIDCQSTCRRQHKFCKKKSTYQKQKSNQLGLTSLFVLVLGWPCYSNHGTWRTYEYHYWYPVGSGYTQSPKIHSVNPTSRTWAPQILQKIFSFNCSWGNLRSGGPSWGSLRGRRSRGKGKGIRARELARGRREEGNAYKVLIKK